MSTLDRLLVALVAVGLCLNSWSTFQTSRTGYQMAKVNLALTRANLDTAKKLSCDDEVTP